MSYFKMDKLKRKVELMPDEIIQGYLDQGEIFERLGFPVWIEANKILRAELDKRHKENRE